MESLNNPLRDCASLRESQGNLWQSIILNFPPQKCAREFLGV